MKYLPVLSLLILLSFSVNAQYTLSIEAGYSDYITKQPSFPLNEDILNGFVNFEPLRSWRVTIDRRFKKEKIHADINPSIGYTIFDKLMVRASFSYGLNRALKPKGRDYEYRISALRLGLQYEFFSKRKTK